MKSDFRNFYMQLEIIRNNFKNQIDRCEKSVYDIKTINILSGCKVLKFYVVISLDSFPVKHSLGYQSNRQNFLLRNIFRKGVVCNRGFFVMHISGRSCNDRPGLWKGL